MKLKCHLCGRAYSCLRSIKRHFNVKHKKTVSGYECPICDHIANRRDNYIRHMRLKHEYKPEEDVPDPKVHLYNPVAEAKTPTITRPWESVPKLGPNSDYSNVKFRVVPGTSKADIKKKRHPIFVPQTQANSTSPLVKNPCFEETAPFNISDQEDKQIEAASSSSNTSTYWQKMLQVDNDYLQTLKEDLYLSTSSSSSDDEDYIDPLKLNWDQLIVLDEWPSTSK